MGVQRVRDEANRVKKRGGPIVRGSGGVFLFGFLFLVFFNKTIKKGKVTTEKQQGEREDKGRSDQTLEENRRENKNIIPQKNRRKEEKGLQGGNNKRREQKRRERKIR